MADVDFLTLDDVLFIHRDQTTRYGGDPGVRDLNLLDSAIALAPPDPLGHAQPSSP
jgi:hypothetical protein